MNILNKTIAIKPLNIARFAVVLFAGFLFILYTGLSITSPIFWLFNFAIITYGVLSHIAGFEKGGDDVADEIEGQLPALLERAHQRGITAQLEIPAIAKQITDEINRQMAEAQKAREAKEEEEMVPVSVKLNDLLDKISAHGIESLTEAEKKQLENLSK